MRSSSRLIFALFALLSLLGTFWVRGGRAQSPCGDTYVVLPGDTLTGIANKCGVTEQSILALNPEIIDSTQIFVGQVLDMPNPETATPPEVAISPICGQPGTLIALLASGFPEDSPVQISVGQKGQPSIVISSIQSDQFGRIQTTFRIPSSAIPEKPWLVYTESLTGVPVLKGVSTEFWITGFAPDPNSATTYVVQQGDTLRSIATKFNRSLEAILDANPQITSFAGINAGQRINIPAQEENHPSTTLLPVCGPPGNSIQATGSGFTASSTVNLKIGTYLNPSSPATTAFVDSVGNFTAGLVIPMSATTGEQWVVTAESGGSPFIRSVSNIYSVTPPADPTASSIYIVRSGDTLNQIAIAKQRTVSSILAANPQIRNPNQLNVNDTLLIPRLDPTIVISPVSGPPFTVVQVLGVAYPINSNIEIGISKKGTPPQFVEVVTTDPAGNFTSQAIIPGTARFGETWVISTRYALANGTLITRYSSDFIIAQPSPSLVPAITIWPTSGSPGVDLYVVAYNFPPFTQVSIELTQVDAAPIPILTTWSDINGSFAAVTEIPETAQNGETWVVNAEVTNDPEISASSETFTVISP